MSLFAELKRRNVFRVAVAYLALGWIVTQVTSTVAPMLRLPEWVGPVVLWIGVIAFPFVLLFAWIYELTPDGIKRETQVDRTQSITHHTARRLDVVVIALLVAAIGLYAYQQFRPAAPERLAGTETTMSGAPGVAAPPDRSLAVLPFVNMSEDKANEYFADGLSEELLNLLAQVPQLRVIARTSSFSFKGREVDIAEIARRLNVAYVLEGSVRKSGDRLRITAQLIRASDSSHLWSETYDRHVADTFAIQDDIAGAVVGQLEVKLLGKAPVARPIDPAAYEAYLQAIALARQLTPEGMRDSIALLQQVLAVEPDYAPAWDRLAGNYLNEGNRRMRPMEEAIRLGRDAIRRTLALDANYAPAYARRAYASMTYDADLAAAARDLEHAAELAPSDPIVLSGATLLANALGRSGLAIALGNWGVQTDPVNPVAQQNSGLAYVCAGQPGKALERFVAAARLSPTSAGSHFAIARQLLVLGRAPAALEEAKKEADERMRPIGLSIVEYATGRREESEALLNAVIQTYGTDAAYQIAFTYALRGANDQAFEWLAKAVSSHDPRVHRIAVEPLFRGLHADPRWSPLLRRLGMDPEQLAAIKFDVKVPQ